MADDWSYALTVRHLLSTGQYQLNDWAAANMPVQIYWAASLAKCFGYTLSVLRLSTLALLLIALVSLYCMLRDFYVAADEASLLTAVMAASPPVFFLSFTFQTDVQFLGWQILALWLYSRALRQNSYLFMTGGALAATAAVGTRQFGVALVAGLVAVWLFVERQRFRKAPFYLLGLGLPLLATVWQFSSGMKSPTFSQKVRLTEQWAYLSNPPRLIGDFFWRPAVILQYIALYLIPVLPLVAILAQRAWEKGRTEPRSDKLPSAQRRLWPLTWIAYLGVTVCFGYFFYLRHVLMPYLAWLLPNNQTIDFGFKNHLLLTLLTAIFAAALGWLLSRRYLNVQHWQKISRPETFIAFSGLALLGVQLIYAQFYDVYLIQFLPFVLLALGLMCPRWPGWLKATICGLSAVGLVVSLFWTRGSLERAEANWRAAEIAQSNGAAPEDVAGNMTWSCYHGAFDAWLRQVGGIAAAQSYNGGHRMHFAFFDFLDQRFSHASFILSPSVSQQAGKKSAVIATVPYRDEFVRARQIEIVKNN
jgi:4-amino-4-deoxy-L-arabinose transferase-like glycosyltransferase